MKRIKNFYLMFMISLVLISPSFALDTKLTPNEAKEIAKEAYIYGLPMVLNYKTMYSYAVDKKSPEYKGSFNHLACEARVFTP